MALSRFSSAVVASRKSQLRFFKFKNYKFWKISEITAQDSHFCQRHSRNFVIVEASHPSFLVVDVLRLLKFRFPTQRYA